jgi:hypothetical protein
MKSRKSYLHVIRPTLRLWLLLFATITACSSQREPNQALRSSISTQVAQAFEATRVAQTTLAEGTRQAVMAASPIPSPTIPFTATPTDLPTLTFTPSPTLTETPTTMPSETPTTTQVGTIPENAIVFYLTLLGTGGPVGCGDSLIKLTTGYTRTGDTAADLKVALDMVFSAGQNPGGLYNATYPSRLIVDSVNLTPDGVAIVYFSGLYQKPADSCDASRYRSQVWATALQFKELKRFEPYVGNALLGDRLAVYSDSGK